MDFNWQEKVAFWRTDFVPHGQVRYAAAVRWGSSGVGVIMNVFPCILSSM